MKHKGHKFRRPDSERISHADLVRRFELIPDGIRRRPIKFHKGPGGGELKKTGRVKSNGYHSIKVDGKDYMTHHLVWFYVHKKWPLEIDHFPDPNKLNNGIENLRECTRKENMAFRRRGVIRTCKDGHEKFYPAINVAASDCLTSSENIHCVLSGKQNTAAGFSWRYA